jgi:rod shape-determining protein MreC
LITDRDHAIPVLNTRTGARGVAYGDASLHADAMELRFMAANADVHGWRPADHQRRGRHLSAGLPVARVERVERRVDAVFARIYCVPLAHWFPARQRMWWCWTRPPDPSPTVPARGDATSRSSQMNELKLQSIWWAAPA